MSSVLDLNLRAFEKERRLVFAELADELRDRPALRRREENKVWLEELIQTEVTELIEANCKVAS